MPFVLGHARAMNAIQGGKATHDTIAAQQIAVLLRGGMLPQAYVDPAAMRATRDLRRRRRPLMRNRAELLAHIQPTNRQSHLAEIGKQLADNANRAGVAARFPEPAGPTSLHVDLAPIDHSDHLLRDMALIVLNTATQHNPNTRDRLRTVPGLGEILRLGLLHDIHDSRRFPRAQEFVSYCRLGKWARGSAGKRHGSSGTQIGHADLPWAFSEAAVLSRRGNPAGPTYLARVAETPSQGQA